MIAEVVDEAPACVEQEPAEYSAINPDRGSLKIFFPGLDNRPCEVVPEGQSLSDIVFGGLISFDEV